VKRTAFYAGVEFFQQLLKLHLHRLQPPGAPYLSRHFRLAFRSISK